MHTVKTADLKPGMVTAVHVKTKAGQIIVEKNTFLSHQMIAHIEYYNIPSVKILDGAFPDATIRTMAIEQQASESYFQRIRESHEFREFKDSYEKKVDFLERSLNDAVARNLPLDTDSLLEQALQLFAKNATTISMFDMLHNMRSINDSTYAHSMNVALIGRMIGAWMNFDSKALDILTFLERIANTYVGNSVLLSNGVTGKIVLINKQFLTRPVIQISDKEFMNLEEHPEIYVQAII